LFVAVHGSRTGKRDLTDIVGRPLVQQEEEIMTNLDEVNVSPREQQVLNLLVHYLVLGGGCILWGLLILGVWYLIVSAKL
jgi:hypothetical protein